MSFFSNPLAEEDEVVPPDYPLGQYDERKREDDFNELLVRSTKLEAEQRAAENAAAVEQQPALVACIQQNQHIRATLEEMWAEMSSFEGRARREATGHSPSQEAAPSALPVVVADAVSAQMSAAVSQLETAAAHQRALVDARAAPLIAGAQTTAASSAASAFTALRTAPLHSTVSHPTDIVDTAEVEATVRALDAQLPRMSAEEAALATAAVQHLLCGLQSWSSLRERHAVLQRSVAAKTQEQQEAQLAAQTVALWTASRQLAGEAAELGDAAVAELTSYGSAGAPTAAQSLSFDLALAESHNKELNDGNLRLEAVLARLLAEQKKAGEAGQPQPPQQQLTPLTGSALVHYVALLEQSRDLEAEVQRLGTAVLYLRAALSDPSCANAQELVRAAPADGAVSFVTPCDAMWAARQAQINALEKQLHQQPGALDQCTASTGDGGVQSVLLHGLTRLQELYDASLRGVAVLSAYFAKQSGNATFLLHAARGGGPLDDAVVERVLDLPEVDVAAVRQALDAAAAAACTGLADELRNTVEAAVKESAATMARWEAVRSLLTDLLGAAIALLPQGISDAQEVSSLLASYADQSTAPRDAGAVPVQGSVRTVPGWAAVLTEEVDVFKAEKAEHHKLVKDYWLTQQAEANKKLTWLMKQPNAPLLLQLCAAEKTRADLQTQLESVSSAAVDASGLQQELDEVQRELAAETLRNTALQAETEEMEASAAQLEQERAALLRSMHA